MKTFFQLFAMLLFCNFAIAQQKNAIPALPNTTPKLPTTLHTKLLDPEALKRLKTPQSRDYFAGWLNYALEYDSATSAGGPFYSPLLLFPDTSIIYTVSGGTTFRPLYHSAATTLDPFNMLMPNETLSNGASYTMDSVTFTYAYIRNLDTAQFVDTLVLDVFHSYPGFWYSTLTNSGDTVRWKFVPYDHTTNEVADSAILDRIVMPMKSQFDTTQSAPGTIPYIRLLKHAIPVTNVNPIGYPEVIGVAISFRPGFGYSLANNDSIGAKNGFFLGSSEENGFNTAQTVNPPYNFNTSYVATNTDRYNDTTNPSFSIQYYPAIGYSDAFPFENHMILFHISSNNNGVKDLSISNGLNFYPNPTNGEANFYYNLGRNAKEVSLSLFDVTGKQVQFINEGAQAGGKHNLRINTEGLSSGMYFYSFSVDGQANNGKFIVD